MEMSITLQHREVVLLQKTYATLGCFQYGASS